MKTKVLIVYTAMIIGGATTSLLTLLHTINYDKYDVDLLLYENNGLRQNEIPKDVHVLPQANPKTASILSRIYRKIGSPAYVAATIRASYYSYIRKKRLVAIQIMSRQGARYSRKLENVYDVAISYLEFWPLNYMSRFIKAKRKISWIHIDYMQSGLSAKLDEAAFQSVDHIVLVSQKCLKNFIELCPRFASKAVYIANLMSQGMIRDAANIEMIKLPSKQGTNILRLVTVCRLDFNQKGLDRGIIAFKRLKDHNMLTNVQWFIIGDGNDREAMEKMIDSFGLQNEIILLGEQMRPLPYVAQCDAFFLPAKYEGKPMAVTEAQMLGLPSLVTEYTSAREQIRDGIDGMVFENSTEGIFVGLKRILQDRRLLDDMHKNTVNSDYSNTSEIIHIENLIDGGEF